MKLRVAADRDNVYFTWQSQRWPSLLNWKHLPLRLPQAGIGKNKWRWWHPKCRVDLTTCLVRMWERKAQKGSCQFRGWTRWQRAVTNTQHRHYAMEKLMNAKKQGWWWTPIMSHYDSDQISVISSSFALIWDLSGQNCIMRRARSIRWWKEVWPLLSRQTTHVVHKTDHQLRHASELCRKMSNANSMNMEYCILWNSKMVNCTSLRLDDHLTCWIIHQLHSVAGHLSIYSIHNLTKQSPIFNCHCSKRVWNLPDSSLDICLYK